MRALASVLTLASVFALVSHASALEMVSIRDADEDGHGWQSGGASCSIVYYNRCTFWSYGWAGWADGERIGVCADNCCAPNAGLVTATQLRVFSGTPPGYGFTGSIALHLVDDNCCPGPVLFSRPYLPTGPFDVHFWNQYVPGTFACVVTMEGAGNTAVIGTDHPAAGPTGPQACGFCYPLTRVNHSFRWGSLSSPICPGTPFNDGTCDAQLRMDIYATGCTGAVEPASWGSIKALYR